MTILIGSSSIETMRVKVSTIISSCLLVLGLGFSLPAQETQTRTEREEVPLLHDLTLEKIQDILIDYDTTNFNQGNNYDPWQLIQGRVAGVSITRPGGDPNGEYVIRIRGLTTLSSDWRPLIVVDGVAGISLEHIDPNDIADIQVLKEAAASAFYGMRGANGVVVITTRRAREGVPSVTAHASVSIDRVAKMHQTLDAQTFRSSGGFDLGSDTNWSDLFLQTGLTENLGFSIRQTVGGTSYSASVNYRDIEGLVGPSKRRRLNTAFVVSQRAINDRLNLSIRVNSTTQTSSTVNSSLFREMTIYNPTAPVFDDVNTVQDGGYFQQGFFANPLSIQNEQFYMTEGRSLLLSGQFSFEINHFLSIHGQYTQDRSALIQGRYNSRFDQQIGASYQGIARRSTDDYLRELGDLSIRVNKQLNSKFRVQAELGMGFINNDVQGFNAISSRYLFDSQTFNNLGAGANRNSQGGSNSYRSVDKMNSYYARVAVNYKDNLSGYFNVRSDAYSGLGGSRGLFYGGGFRYDVTSVMDAGRYNKLSLRMSYGVTGNRPDPYLGEAFYNVGNVVDLDRDPNSSDDQFRGLRQFWNANPELTWETVKEFNLGMDFELASLGITGSIDYFSRKSEDLIFREFVLVGSPNVFAPDEFFTTSAVNTNFFDLSSSGIEISLNYQKKLWNKLNWESEFNTIFYQQPTIDRMSSKTDNTFERLSGFGFISFVNGTNFVTRQVLGEEVGGLYTPRFLGVTETGEPLVDGNTFGDLEKSGNSLPSADLGFYNRMTMGKWELNFLIRGTLGHSLLNVTRMIYENTPTFLTPTNIVTSDKDPNVNATVVSDLYVEDASFLRLNHLTIARDFYLSNARRLNVSLTGQNLFNITQYAGIDPEVRYLDSNQGFAPYQALASGIATRELYFPSRTWTLAVRLNF